MENLEQIVSHFAISGKVEKIEPTGNGHINRTYLVKTDKNEYILQKINNVVFQNVNALMNNIVRVTEYLLEKRIFTLKYKPTLDGKLYYSAEDGYYRVFQFIYNSICYEGIEDLEVIRKAGSAFGQLHRDLAGIDTSEIVEVIPDFHNTKERYKAFLKSIEKDPKGRVAFVKDEIKFLNDNAKYYSILVDAIENKEIPLGITHNDPKINNVLFNKDTKDVRCVIDLDTVMPGTFLNDFGDALRSLFTGANEDTTDLSKLVANLDVYRAYLDGYYSKRRHTLNKKEIELLPYSVLVLTLELCLRFLKDYIDGDIYFATKRENHNLDRARTQIALSKDILKNMDNLKSITREIVSKYDNY